MMPIDHREVAFESAIEDYLLRNAGYAKGDVDSFDQVRCLDRTVLLAYIKETQPKEWNYLVTALKDKAEETLLDSLCRALDSEYEGCLMVLRHGFKCYGKLFHAAYFKPASGLNPEIQAFYDANRLTVTRQLRYSNEHTKKLDLVLSLNGIPIVTAEIKNPLTGQTWRDAVYQYKNDRDPKDLIFQFKKRTMVHFAIDTEEVHMTTAIAGRSTNFLPFNKGDGTGAGNPLNPDGYKTDYLWRQVWERESLLDIVAHFIHIEIKEVKLENKIVRSEKVVFPRYHQLDCVRKLVVDARARGLGNNYLVQHSTGSGKSLSIAWLAYRLSSLHDDNDNKLFSSVVVVTDRVVLDQQLQNTIYQFEHKQGVVAKIDVDSSQLAHALATEVPIVITTIQKFPFVTEKVGGLPGRNYAVIIDEAHSSQGGERARDLKSVLAGGAVKNEGQEERIVPDYEEEVLKVMSQRGKQPNISFIAFTATPRYKTLEVFGQTDPDGKPQPFHLYSMRQAIEEGFILDVLKNYITYRTYYRLNKSVETDPNVDKRKAAQALARFVTLHPHNIAQKTEVMVEHFWHFTRHKIGGKAKAMVVTNGRLHAVRYKEAFDKYIAEKDYQGIKALVAFSGTVIDPDIPDRTYTEVGMNKGIKETELPERFGSGEYQVLLVAEKYQTGFDQPLLHTMYVDRRLSGLDAVQTLSRLNRTHIGKDDTFVLDFVNEPKEIQEAFQPYYEKTVVGAQAEPSQLYELSAKLEGYKIFFRAEVDEFAKVFYKPSDKQTATDHAKINACLDPAVNRFGELGDRQDEFRKTVIAFLNLYSFLSQVLPFQDPDLEKLYSYLRFLLTKLPRRSGASYNFEDEVTLQYYRLQKISEGSIELKAGEKMPISGPTSLKTGADHEVKIKLSKLIDILNERFGTEFKPGDQLFFESIREDALSNPDLHQSALVNTKENFNYLFKRVLENIFVGRMGQNEEITARFLNDKEFREAVTENLLDQVYEKLRQDEKQNES
jgi:type I restriction enzyme R subunit